MTSIPAEEVQPVVWQQRVPWQMPVSEGETPSEVLGPFLEAPGVRCKETDGEVPGSPEVLRKNDPGDRRGLRLGTEVGQTSELTEETREIAV